MREHADPPGMPEDERMTPAEFRVVREFLGLTGDWLAARLQVNPRTVRAWEQGRHPIPDGVRLEMERLEAETGEFVGRAVDALMDLPDPAIVTYRSDEEYRAAHPGVSWPAAWHRMVCARIALEVPALSIVYPDSVPPGAAVEVPRRAGKSRA